MLSTMITVLYMLLTTLFMMAWTMLHHAFIQNGDNYYTVITVLGDQGSWCLGSKLWLRLSLQGLGISKTPSWAQSPQDWQAQAGLGLSRDLEGYAMVPIIVVLLLYHE
ncbi:hypothetical protein ARMGADRAFT_1028294 [Armillaria gallica]|uniref:Uncharacterized protein n=1 Tax=Armillaria gallica TaxID=47427 RepID=A0A2H3E413_ARMGA|nr:hypothetical protein ARMGADRAFT_1028294 [Armillaria gallica]